MKKITLATVKSFVKNNNDLQIRVKSSFDGMVDCEMPVDDGFSKAEKTDRNEKHTLGISGAWFVLGSRDYFYEYSDGKRTGFQVSNCCGCFILAINN